VDTAYEIMRYALYKEVEKKSRRKRQKMGIPEDSDDSDKERYLKNVS
jgi:hypothetical protein